jgi:hypothetical protein
MSFGRGIFNRFLEHYGQANDSPSMLAPFFGLLHENIFRIIFPSALESACLSSLVMDWNAGLCFI